MKNKLLSERDLIDWWLGKFHQTTLTEVESQHPEWMAEPEKYTHDFYEEYAVTQEQHDEWEKWATATLKKQTGRSGIYFQRSWAWVYLNVAPEIKK